MAFFISIVEENLNSLQEWARKTHTDAYRIYDRELPDYPIAIDHYAGRLAIQYFAKSREEVPSELIQEVDQS